MGQKKIKRSKVEGTYVDPELEEVDEERAFEIEADEETNEILLVHHYRRKWGDDFDSDVEHGLNLQEAKNLVSVILRWIDMEETRLKSIIGIPDKSTPIPIEGNPMQGPNNLDGK
jgi:hypothetical protein